MQYTDRDFFYLSNTKSEKKAANKKHQPKTSTKNINLKNQPKYTAFLEEGWGLGKGETSFLVKRSFPLPQEHSSSSIKRVKQLFYAFIQYRVDEIGSGFHHKFKDKHPLVHTRVWDGEAWSVYHFVSEKDNIAVEGA